MTAMPARHFGLDRGELAPGKSADLVVLDLDRLADGSTLEHPLAYVEGVDEVLVNGTAVVAGGEHNRARASSASRSSIGVGSTEPGVDVDLRSDFAPPTEEMWRRCGRPGSAGRSPAKTRA
jgi:adenine deaminase